MKKGQLSEKEFSYQDFIGKYSDMNYVLVVKDQEYPNSNLFTILYNDKGKIYDILDEEMEKVLATKALHQTPDLEQKYSPQQLLKISSGTIIKNEKYTDNSTFPKCITFYTNIHDFGPNEIIEIFEGKVTEENGVFELKQKALHSLVKDCYIQSSNSFFILENDALIGPFKVKNTDTSGEFIVEKSLWKQFGKYKFEIDSFIEFRVNDITRRIHIPKVNELQIIEKLDFVTDNDLIDEFELDIYSHPEQYSEINTKVLLSTLKEVISSNYVQSTQQSERIIRLLKKAETKVISKIDIGKVFPEITELKTEIDNLKLEKLSLQSELEKVLDQKNRTENEILLVDTDLKSLRDEITHIEKFIEEKAKEQKTNLESEIKRLEQQKASLDTEIEIERNKKEEKIKNLENLIKYLEEKENSLKSGIKTLQDEFTNEQKSAHLKLKELLMQNQHYNILSGREIFGESHTPLNSFTSFQIVKSTGENLSKFEKYKNLKENILTILNKNNRRIDSHFLDNILLSIHQNTLTLFAGLPGTGKTSLVRLLINILTPRERIREVAVSRGWTSQKDLIGFLNPLSKLFHASPTNLYNLLKQLDWEREREIFMDSPLAYVLLDEANLSPLEHYWSVFYNLTDNYASKNNYLKINLGDSEVLEYPNNLRFIGTINYDQTTEELSPRVIDRTNIIRMDNNKSLDINRLTSMDISNINLSFRDCIDIFGLIDFSDQHDISMDETFDREFNDIKRKFEELKIYISPRVQISIKQYCKIANTIMYEKNKPLDYCISQRLLPLIRVQGSSAKAKLNELKDILDKNKYDISSRILTDIIQRGEEGEVFQDNFNYFLTLSNV
ncbi:hypothetical protein [Flectobacillus sp. BAB-3569]|uniref:hypothetical protein n=1 Tax=Flectobacillus sp. BAB-3569 TaxID=1509483 RepID=UPI000BA345BA|nr:hypothetical protein [Flectobacillus sp. BAB-3569]PAC29682.1 hypothetical protein BWI92_14365 [Flectobacillus sp. BAB-3569]